MKNIFKVGMVFLAALGFSSASIAQPSWYLPYLTGFYVGLNGVDFQSRNGDQDFIQVFPASQQSDFNINTLSSRYHSGFAVFGGINFCEDDIAFNWLRFNSNDQNPFGTPTSTSIIVSQPRWENFSLWKNIYSRVRYDLDAAYVVIGHTIHPTVWDIRFAAGLEYVNLDSNMFVTSNLLSTPGVTYGHDASSRLKGIGPRIEVDMNYHLPYQFSLYGNANLALLSSTRSVVLNNLNTLDNTNFAVNLTRRTIYVPKFGMKLGVNYEYAFCMQDELGNQVRNSLLLQAGWMVDSYIHVVERVSNDSVNTATTISNYSYSGFFFGFTANVGLI